MPAKPTTPEPPIPAELIAGEVPFLDDELAEAIALIAEGGYGPADLLALTADEIQIDGDPEVPSSIARTAGWRISSLDEAEWAARKLSAASQDVAALAAQARDWRARIDEWEATATAASKRTHEFFERALAAFALERRAEDPKRNKTTTVPSARVSTRTVNAGGKLVVVDEDLLLEWAVDALDVATYERVIKTVQKPVLAELRSVAEVATSDGSDGVVESRALYAGEVIPGTEVAPESISVTVTPTA